MIIFKTIPNKTKLCKKYLVSSKNLYRPLSPSAVHYAKRGLSIDLVYDTYENVNTRNDLPPVIIMHGLFGSKQNWRSFSNALLLRTYNRKIIVIDARNHGESPHTEEHRYEDMTEDIVMLLKKENIKRCAVLGHSMGARCMMYVALKYPHLVEKAIFVENSPLSSGHSLRRAATAFNAFKSINLSPKLNMFEARKQADIRLKHLMIRDKMLRDFFLTNFIQHADGKFGWRFNLEALYKSYATNIVQFPVNALKLKYPGPALFIGGSQSNYIKKSDIPDIKLLFPGAHVSYISDAGHYVHREQPEIFLLLVKQFLNHLHKY